MLHIRPDAPEASPDVGADTVVDALLDAATRASEEAEIQIAQLRRATANRKMRAALLVVARACPEFTGLAVDGDTRDGGYVATVNCPHNDTSYFGDFLDGHGMDADWIQSELGSLGREGFFSRETFADFGLHVREYDRGRPLPRETHRALVADVSGIHPANTDALAMFDDDDPLLVDPERDRDRITLALEMSPDP